MSLPAGHPLKQAGRIARTVQRLGTSGLRPFPDFLIIGAQKSGTTSLYRYLDMHPDVRRPLRKEVHFFDVNYARGAAWYRSHFPLRPPTPQGGGWVTGEATPAYLFYPPAPRRAAAVIPGVKCIAVLRNPVDRAFSHYHHETAKGRETLSFEEALEVEPERAGRGWERALKDENHYSEASLRFSYLARGRYAEQLERWLQFFPRDQLLVLKAENLFVNPAATVSLALRFLGLRPHAVPASPARNARTYAPIDPKLRQKLAAYFESHNRRLYELLGESFDWE